MMDKLLTTKFPLGVVLMELATQLARRGATLRANWIPRDQNEEADALTNLDFRHFDPARRVEVDLERLQFNVMKDLFAAGDDYLAELDALKLKAKSSPASAPAAGEKTRKRQFRRCVRPIPGRELGGIVPCCLLRRVERAAICFACVTKRLCEWGLRDRRFRRPLS